MNTYFIDAVQNFDIKKFYDIEEENTDDSDLSPKEKIDQILEKYETHPSVIMIKNKVNVSKRFK